jgi:putative ABC transport system substrate-binding protein
LGYVETQNIAIEWRFPDGSEDQLRGFAAELARLPVDVLVAGGSPAAVAAKNATSTIPIVAVGIGDPVGIGLVASLGRPGGNVTALSLLTSALSVKQLELLKEAVPGVSRMAVLWDSGNPSGVHIWNETQAAARVLGVQLQSLEVRTPDDFDGAFEGAIREHAEAMAVLGAPLTRAQRARIVDFAARSRLPTMYSDREFVEAGGLMAYAANRVAGYHRAAYYVDRILKGTKPADLPVEQPMTFDFVMNLKTAQALGITFPREILLQVTEMIQ